MLEDSTEFQSMNLKGLNTELRAICYNNANSSHHDGQVLTKTEFKMNLLTRRNLSFLRFVFQSRDRGASRYWRWWEGRKTVSG